MSVAERDMTEAPTRGWLTLRQAVPIVGMSLTKLGLLCANDSILARKDPWPHGSAGYRWQVFVDGNNVVGKGMWPRVTDETPVVGSFVDSLIAMRPTRTGWITLAEAAEELGENREMLRRRVSAGEFVARKDADRNGPTWKVLMTPDGLARVQPASPTPDTGLAVEPTVAVSDLPPMSAPDPIEPASAPPPFIDATCIKPPMLPFSDALVADDDEDACKCDDEPWWADAVRPWIGPLLNVVCLLVLAFALYEFVKIASLMQDIWFEQMRWVAGR